EYFDFWYNMLTHDVANRRSTAVFSNASANVPATFEDSQNHSFVRHSEFMSTFIFVDVTGLSSNESLIHFDVLSVTAEFAKGFILHSETDAMHHEPCSLLGDFHISRDFVGADSVFAVRKHPSCGKPLVQPNSGILEDRSDFDRELPFCVMTCTLPDTARCVELHTVRATSRANDAL